MNERVIPLTDDAGRVLNPDQAEPSKDSVVLANGLHGTAWQRHADGRWHKAGSSGVAQGRAWDLMLKQRGLVLVYEAPRRTADTRTTSAVRV